MIVDSEFSRKKLLVFGALIFVVIAIPVTVYMALQQQNSQSKAEVETEVPEDSVIMIIDGEQITKAQIREVAEEQNDPTAVDHQALMDAKETLEERKILDVAAKTYNITLEQDRVERFKQEELSDTEAKYEALKQQIVLKAVNSVEALSIGFWNPPAADIDTLSTEERVDAAEQLTEGIPVLDEIETRMTSGEDTLEIADSVLEDNPDLEPVLAVNGYIYSLLTGVERAISSYPAIYEWGDNSIDDQTRNAIFTLAVDSVEKVQDTKDNRGGSVFRIINKGNTSGSSTYEAWLTEQKTILVQDVSTL